MRANQIFFFAEANDIRPIIEKIESINDIHYFLTGLFDDGSPVEYDSILRVPDFGYVKNDDWNLNPSYILLPRSQSVIIRTVPQRNGGLKFAIDQLLNPASCVIKLGGVYDGNILVGGIIGSVSSSDFSIQVIKAFSSLIKSEFKKMGQFYVGEGARTKLGEGWKLVTNAKSPVGYDLKE